jgi:addiction module RelB/DinJ family antitoxin
MAEEILNPMVSPAAIFQVEQYAQRCHNCGMSTVWRVRVDKSVLNKAERVTKRLGTSTQEMVRVFLTQIARSGKVPLKLDLDDDLVDVRRRNRIWGELDDTKDW